MSYSCAMPFKTLLIDQDGQCGPCCNNAGAFKMKSIEIKNRWQSAEFTELRKKHLLNSPAPECQRCYIEEKSGYNSQRIISNTQIYPDFDNQKLELKQSQGPEMPVDSSDRYFHSFCRMCVTDSSCDLGAQLIALQPI